MDTRFPGQNQSKKSKVDLHKIAYAVGAVLLIIVLYWIFKPSADVAVKSTLGAESAQYNENLNQIATILKQQQESINSLSSLLKLVGLIAGLSFLLNLLIFIKGFVSKTDKTKSVDQKKEAVDKTPLG